MLWSLASPADNARGPQYLAAALAAWHRAFRSRSRCELLIARHAGQVGLYVRAARGLSPVVQGQLQAAYPDLRIESVEDDAFAPQASEVGIWARLRLTPNTASLVPLETLLDQERQLVDPLTGVFAALSSRKAERLRPMVSLVVRPAGWFAEWRARRRLGGPEKLRGAFWLVDVRLAVNAPASHRLAAVAKIHELSGVIAHCLPPAEATVKLSRIRGGALPRRLSWLSRWLLSHGELATLWHSPTTTVRTAELRTIGSRQLEPPIREQLPLASVNSTLAVLGRVAFRDRRETFGMLPEDRFRHLYVIGLTCPHA